MNLPDKYIAELEARLVLADALAKSIEELLNYIADPDLVVLRVNEKRTDVHIRLREYREAK